MPFDDMEEVERAREALSVAKIWLQRRIPMIGSELLRIDVVVVLPVQIATAATDGRMILFSAAFVNELDKADRSTTPPNTTLAGVLMHELIHIAFEHLGRRKERNALLWNCAADYVTNLMVLDFGLHLPQSALVDRSFEQHSVEQVYRFLAKDPDQGKKHVRARYGSMSADDHLTHDDAARLAQSVGVQPTELERLPEITWSLRKALLDTGQQMQRNFMAEQKAVDAAHVPAPCWQRLLSQWCTQVSRNETSFARPNRRLLGQGMVLPGLHGRTIDGLIIGLDSSGSRWNMSVLQKVFGHIEQLRAVLGCGLRLVMFDHQVKQVLSFDPHEALPSRLTIAGGGGTDFRCFFAEAERIRRDFAWQQAPIIIITDALGIMPPQPADRTCWLIPKTFPATVPFGVVVRYDETDAPVPPTDIRLPSPYPGPPPV